MIFGIDVTHPKPGSEGPSVAAIVGSLNKEVRPPLVLNTSILG